MESTFNRISRKTGRKQVSCKCSLCKKQCSVAPCLGTPDDIEKLIDAGHGSKILLTEWLAGKMMGILPYSLPMYQAAYDEYKKTCVFFTNGLCELHTCGLKPTEGKLSHHTNGIDNFKATKTISWNVAKEWINPDNFDTIRRIKDKLTKIK